jgi:uncharacterized membrane protein YfcA
VTALAAVPVGLVVGLLLGALGGGGSILAVPALVYLLGQSPHAATTDALVVVGLSAVTAMLAHHRGGRVRVAHGVTFGLLGVAGTYAGTRASASVDPNLLLAGFAGLMAVAALGMLRRRRTPSTEDSQGQWAHGRRACATGCAAKVVATASVVGLLTGLFGVGGGFIVVPALVLALGFDMATAVGTSLLVITTNAGTALAARIGSGTPLNWPLLVVFTLAAMSGSLAGQKVTTRVPARTLTVAFASLCLCLAGFIAAHTVPHLLST